ncbi:hypothetical protein JRQ81_019504, partial [Phrynocephalus forsythii]
MKGIVHDMGVWLEWLPNTYVTWSTVIPRRSWGMECDPHKMNHAHIGVNQEDPHELLKVGGSVIGHQNINADKPDLYRSDGVHLSNSGLGLFLANMCEGLQE